MVPITTILVSAIQRAHAAPREIAIGRARSALALKTRVAGRLGLERLLFNWPHRVCVCARYMCRSAGRQWWHRVPEESEGAHWRALKAGRRVPGRNKAAR